MFRIIRYNVQVFPIKFEKIIIDVQAVLAWKAESLRTGCQHGPVLVIALFVFDCPRLLVVLSHGKKK